MGSNIKSGGKGAAPKSNLIMLGNGEAAIKVVKILVDDSVIDEANNQLNSKIKLTDVKVNASIDINKDLEKAVGEAVTKAIKTIVPDSMKTFAQALKGVNSKSLEKLAKMGDVAADNAVKKEQKLRAEKLRQKLEDLDNVDLQNKLSENRKRIMRDALEFAASDEAVKLKAEEKDKLSKEEAKANIRNAQNARLGVLRANAMKEGLDSAAKVSAARAEAAENARLNVKHQRLAEIKADAKEIAIEQENGRIDVQLKRFDELKAKRLEEYQERSDIRVEEFKKKREIEWEYKNKPKKTDFEKLVERWKEINQERDRDMKIYDVRSVYKMSVKQKKEALKDFGNSTQGKGLKKKLVFGFIGFFVGVAKKIWSIWKAEFKYIFGLSKKLLFKPLKLMLGVLSKIIKQAISSSKILQSIQQLYVTPLILLIEYLFIPVLQKIAPFTGEFIKLITGKISTLTEWGKGIADFIEEIILKPVKEIFGSNGKFWDNPIAGVLDLLSKVMESIMSFIKDHRVEIQTFLVDSLKSLFNFIGTSADLAVSLIAMLAKSLSAAVKSSEFGKMVESVTYAITSIIKMIAYILTKPEVTGAIVDMVVALIGTFLHYKPLIISAVENEVFRRRDQTVQTKAAVEVAQGASMVNSKNPLLLLPGLAMILGGGLILGPPSGVKEVDQYANSNTNGST